MKLFTYDPAPNPRRLALFLQYKGITLDSQQVDLGAAEQLQEHYRQLVPECTVPALQLDDGTVLTEVIGICTYLEGLHPDKPLLGTTPLEKAQVISWDHRLFLTIYLAVAGMLRNRSKAFANRALPGPLDVPQIPDLVERGKLQLAYILPQLDRELGTRPWLAGNSFTFADIDLLVAIDFMAWVRESIPEDCTHLRAWHDRARAELGL
jgi:glutathione S-transferase